MRGAKTGNEGFRNGKKSQQAYLGPGPKLGDLSCFFYVLSLFGNDLLKIGFILLHQVEDFFASTF